MPLLNETKWTNKHNKQTNLLSFRVVVVFFLPLLSVLLFHRCWPFKIVLLRMLLLLLRCCWWWWCFFPFLFVTFFDCARALMLKYNALKKCILLYWLFLVELWQKQREKNTQSKFKITINERRCTDCRASLFRCCCCCCCWCSFFVLLVHFGTSLA